MKVGRGRRDAWAAHFVVQQAGGGQRDVAHDFRIHAETRAAREQAIVLILLVKLRRDARRLPIDGAVHDETVDVFDVPFAGERLFRPARVSEGSMNSTASQSSNPGCEGSGARKPKSSGVSIEPDAEISLPKAIHKNARSGGRFRVHQPFRQASGGCHPRPLGNGCRNAGTPARDFMARLEPVAAIEQVASRVFRRRPLGFARATSVSVGAPSGHWLQSFSIWSLTSLNSGTVVRQ